MATNGERPYPPPGRDVHRTEIDGVPVLWADVPGPFAAGIAFRVGWADEPLASSGITHVVEHLAFHPLGRPSYDSNGTVESLQTNFWASGRKEEVASFLGSITRALSNLPLDRLEHELRVLRTEEESSSADAVAALKRDRFGANGHGTWWYLDFGLRRLEAKEVGEWARRHFTKQNAMLWMSGPPPESLELSLPEGERVLPREPRLNDHPYPTCVLEGSGSVALTMYGERSVAARAALDYLQRRTERELRFERALTYDVDGRYEIVTPDRVHSSLAIDCLDENAQAVVDGVVAVLDDLAENGLTEEELASNVDDFRRVLDDPESVLGYIAYVVEHELFGSEAESEEQLLRDEEALTPELTAEAIRRFRETLMVQAPPTVDPDESRFNPYATGSEDRIEGTTFKPRKLPFRKAEYTPVVAGEQGAMCVFDDYVLTVPFADCAAVLTRDDGDVLLIREDGTQIGIETSKYRRGDELLRTVLEAAPPGRILKLEPR